MNAARAAALQLATAPQPARARHINTHPRYSPDFPPPALAIAQFRLDHLLAEKESIAHQLASPYPRTDNVTWRPKAESAYGHTLKEISYLKWWIPNVGVHELRRPMTERDRNNALQAVSALLIILDELAEQGIIISGDVEKAAITRARALIGGAQPLAPALTGTHGW